jgi:hypothetical protein
MNGIFLLDALYMTGGKVGYHETEERLHQVDKKGISKGRSGFLAALPELPLSWC